MKKLTLLSLAVSALLIAGCGGGDSTPSNVGTDEGTGGFNDDTNGSTGDNGNDYTVNGLFIIEGKVTSPQAECQDRRATVRMVINDEDISGTGSTITGGFIVTGTRNTTTGKITGGYVLTSRDAQFADYSGQINGEKVNGIWNDQTGCEGTWSGEKQ